MMMIPEQTKIYIPVSEVFTDIQSDFETFKSLLQSLSLTETLFWCAILNLIISNPSDDDHIARQQLGLDYFLTPEEINRVNDFAQKNGSAQRIMIFSRGQLLELLRWGTLYCQNYPESEITFENPEVRRKFVQAALIAFDIWTKRVFGNRFSMDGGVDIARKRGLGAIRKSIEATSLAPDLSKSLGRGWTLFKNYFPRYYKPFADEFRASTGLSIEEYYICLGAMVINFMDPKIGSVIFDPNTLGEAILYRDVFQKYITLESQSIDELREALWGHAVGDINNDEDAPPYDYRPLREKPLLRAESGRTIILDPVFYSERASVGPLFILTKNKTNDKANEIFSTFGYAFESYTCDILRRMFPDISGALTKRLSCNIQGSDRAGNKIEIDACLNDIMEVILFEIKAVWIREDEILSEDYEKYLQHLRKKYGVTEGTSRDRKIKGVGQLARITNMLATTKEWLGQNEEFSQVQLIYPVLVVYDPFLAAPVYGNILASEFKTLLAPEAELQSGELRKGQLRIAPLIVMTIEELENLETSIEHFSFRDLLADYSRACPDRLMSFYNFIATSKYSHQMYHNRSLNTTILEILHKSREAIATTDGNESG